MRLRHGATRAARAGFSLLELVVGSALLVILAGALTQSISGLRGLASSGSLRSDLAEDAERALESIVADLKRSGAGFAGGQLYPAFFQDGAAAGPDAVFAHGAAPDRAGPGEPDFGPDREIVLLRPADLDADGRPDIDGAGDLAWDGVRVAYVRVAGPDGTGELQRRTSDGRVRRLAGRVERVVFDDNASSGFEVPLGSIRARVFLRGTDETGRLYRHVAEAVVRPRN